MDLFVYGTLRNTLMMQAVAGGGLAQPIEATLQGYGVHPLAGDVVPMIRAETDGVTKGIVWRGLEAGQIARLDAYEGAFGYALQPVKVQTADGTDMAAQMYFPPDEAATEPATWSLAAWEADHLAPALYTVAEIFAGGQIPGPGQLRQQWPMIEKRAWMRVRAGGRNGGTSLRHAAKPGDLKISPDGRGAGQFFRFQGFKVLHRRFDDKPPEPMRREVFLGTEAGLLLPYDPIRDKVLLVEQARMGPAVAGDPNPWTLEPVAGMVDARETPLECAIRETQEEAAIEVMRTEHIASFYPSPGSATDYFHAYLGICDLDRAEAYTGGLDGESEDLRLHTIPFDRAISLIDTGEINVGPLITMLWWLAAHRPRLRGGG